MWLVAEEAVDLLTDPTPCGFSCRREGELRAENRKKLRDRGARSWRQLSSPGLPSSGPSRVAIVIGVEEATRRGSASS